MQNNASRRRRGRRRLRWAGALIFVALLAALFVVIYGGAKDEEIAASPSPKPSASVTPAVSPTPSPEFQPYAVTSTVPSKLLAGMGILANGSPQSAYSAAEPFDFGLGETYTAVQGIVTFRGNNFRDGGAYGAVDFSPGKLEKAYNLPTGTLTAPDGTTFSGSGFVGQPLVMTWPKDTRAHMDLYDWAKGQDTLTEVIYATMDGKVYFFELGTGKATRDPLDLGYPFRGSGALDPRGYPILYLGSGGDSEAGASHIFVVSLLNAQVLYEFGAEDSFATRSGAASFDGSPLVDAQTDTLIYPGDNGVLYLLKLNAAFDAQAGTLSVQPSNMVKWHYSGKRTTDDSFWPGTRASCVIWGSCLIVADHGGNLICLDLNTLTVKWAQNVLDDTNDSPVLEMEDGHPYLYISTSFHLGWRGSNTATVPVWKIDAVTGQIVWHTDYTCYSTADLSGGVQGTIAVGKNKLGDLIFVPMARPAVMGGAYGSYLVALDKETGKEAWHVDNNGYSWSSPVVVYDSQGNGYIIYCTTEGYIYLLDGRTGDKLDAAKLGTSIDASPVAYNDMVVVGTRDAEIWGIRLAPPSPPQ